MKKNITKNLTEWCDVWKKCKTILAIFRCQLCLAILAAGLAACLCLYLLCCRCPVGVVGLSFIGNTWARWSRCYKSVPNWCHLGYRKGKLCSRCATLPVLVFPFHHPTLHAVFYHSYLHTNITDLLTTTARNILTFLFHLCQFQMNGFLCFNSLSRLTLAVMT